MNLVRLAPILSGGPTFISLWPKDCRGKKGKSALEEPSRERFERTKVMKTVLCFLTCDARIERLEFDQHKLSQSPRYEKDRG